MNEIYPIAKLGSLILIINRNDLPHVGKERALEVKCVKADLKYGGIDPVIELEKHLKFNPWEEVSEEEGVAILRELTAKFSEQEIAEKIIKPLVKEAVPSLQ